MCAFLKKALHIFKIFLHFFFYKFLMNDSKSVFMVLPIKICIYYRVCLLFHSWKVCMKWALGDMLFRQQKCTNSFADTILCVITFRGCTNNRWKGDLFTIFIYAWKFNLSLSGLCWLRMREIPHIKSRLCLTKCAVRGGMFLKVFLKHLKFNLGWPYFTLVH